LAVDSILARGPTRIGMMSPLLVASTAAESAVTSQGCATAVGTGFKLLHLTRSC